MATKVKPTVGRIVRYVPRSVTPDHNNAEVLPAVVVRTSDDTDCPKMEVNLQVFNDGFANIWERSIPYSEEKDPGTWHWPEISK